MVFVNDLLSVEEWKESVAYRGSLEREELGQYELTFFLQAEELIDLVRQTSRCLEFLYSNLRSLDRPPRCA